MLDNQNQNWEEMKAAARATVDDLISRLPDDVRPEAIRVGYELRKSEFRKDTLGTYARSGPVITLYLESIRDECESSGLNYDHEVERTYLHELGHHLGLDEEGVARLGV